MTEIKEIIDLRDSLKHELDAGYYDALSWGALYIMSRDGDCPAIADQVRGYIDHYGSETKLEVTV